jgi:putative two-component system response regulator
MNHPPASEPRRILLVDDNAATHDGIRNVLCPPRNGSGLADVETELFGKQGSEQTGTEFQIDFAYQGEEAAEMVRRAVHDDRPYVLAFVDVRMPPGWDGLETIRRLWEIDPRLETVLCTANSDHSWTHIVSTLGQTHRLLFLKKPFEAAEVHQLVLALTTKWRLQRDAEVRSGELECLIGIRTEELKQRNRQLEEEVGRHKATTSDLAASNEIRGEQARVLRLLLELSNKLAATGIVDAAIQEVIRTVAVLVSARRISIMLPDVQKRYLTIAGAIGIDQELQRNVRVPVGGEIAGKVFHTRTTVVVNSREDVRPGLPQYDSAFFVSAPLLSKALTTSEHVVGVLNITDHEGGAPFSAADLSNLDMICNMAAVEINNLLTQRARDDAYDSIVTALATLVEYRDDNTGLHLERVTRYSLLLAEALRQMRPYAEVIDTEFLHDLRRAVPLHDIGKVALPDSILCKPDNLTPAEMAVMKRHPEIGAQTIRSIMDRAPGVQFLTMAADLAHCHHERYDGLGYPRGLHGEDIPLSGRIAALVDAYDAMTSQRVYKDAYSHEQAVAIIRQEAGKHFDPILVKAFLSRQAEFAQLADALSDRAIEAVQPA